jgi:type I restriction enzyme S subunit
MTLQKVKIREVFEVETGSTPSTQISSYWEDGTIKWITPKDLGELATRYISDTGRKITRDGLDNSSAKLVPPESIIISSRAPIGYLAILTDSMAFNQGCKALVAKKPNQISPLYVYYQLQTKVKEMNALGSGSTFKEISKEKIENLQVILPPLPIQQQIAAILEKADAAREKRRQANQFTEQFLQSAFLEMFGDPATNPKGWEVVSIDDISIHVSSGSTPLGGQSTYLKDGILFIRSQNVLMNQLDYSDIAHISTEVHLQMKRTWVKNGDVLLNITGASIGRVSYFKGKDDTANVNQHVCIIRPSLDRTLPEYLSYFISMPSYQNVILARNSGATRQAFTFEQIRKFRINLPPLSEQQKFAALVEKVESLRAKQRRSEQELEHLFHSLMQRAFRGELV